MYRTINLSEKRNYKIFYILLSKFKKINNLSMLEIGCGIGIESKFFSPFVKTYVAIDKNPDAITMAIKNKHPIYNNLTFMLDDMMDMKIKDHDIILSINTMSWGM